MTGQIRIVNSGLIEERLQRNRSSGSDPRGTRRVATCVGTAAHSARDFFGKVLAITRAQGVLCFARVCQESAFDQHRRDSGLAKHVITAAADAAIGGGRASGNIDVNG